MKVRPSVKPMCDKCKVIKKRQSYGYLLKVSKPQTTSRLIDGFGF